MDFQNSIKKMATREGERRRLETRAFEEEVAHPVRRFRLRELAYHPSRMSMEERTHIIWENCSLCGMRLASMRRVMHPSLVELISTNAEREDQEACKEHCSDCERCAKWSRLRILPQLLHKLPALAAYLEKLKDWAEFTPSPPVYSFSKGDRGQSAEWKYEVQTGDFQVVLLRMEGNQLFAGVRCSGVPPQATKCYIAVVRGETILENVVDWTPADREYQGRAHFKFAEFGKQEGSASVTVLPFSEE